MEPQSGFNNNVHNIQIYEDIFTLIYEDCDSIFFNAVMSLVSLF